MTEIISRKSQTHYIIKSSNDAELKELLDAIKATNGFEIRAHSDELSSDLKEIGGTYEIKIFRP